MQALPLPRFWTMQHSEACSEQEYGASYIPTGSQQQTLQAVTLHTFTRVPAVGRMEMANMQTLAASGWE